MIRCARSRGEEGFRYPAVIVCGGFGVRVWLTGLGTSVAS